MHERERDIFQDALATGGDDARRAYLDIACAGDDALRRRVEILLHAHEGARQFLERPILEGFVDPSHTAATALIPPGREADTPTRAIAPTAGGAASENDDEDDPLDFLAPTTRPDARGRLAHYEVLEVLGRGGFGTVVRAFDEKLHRMVAIKLMSRALAATSPPRKRFLREARAAAAVRHPHVVAIHAVDEAPVPYLVMEYVAGPTLQAKLDQTGPMEPAEVIRIGLQIAEGLAAAHRQGLVHRDIKPSNILLEDAAERVKITDFGLARAADDASLTQSGVIAGTPLYMAPEQALGEAIDARSDLFSLGSVLYVMATGRPPFRAASTVAVLRRVADDAPRPIHEIIPEVPLALCELIDQLHAKDPADRPASADAVADRLRALRDALRAAPARPRPVVPAGLDPEFRSCPDAKRPKRTHRLRTWFAPNEARTWVILGLILAVLVAIRLAERDGIIHWRDGMIHLGPQIGTLTVRAVPPDARVTVTPLDQAGGRVDRLVRTGDGATPHFLLDPGRYVVGVRSRGGGVATPEQVVTIVAGGNHEVFLGPPPDRMPFPQSPVVSDAPPPVGIGPWGRLVDPVGDVRVGLGGGDDRDRLTLVLPGGRLRDLNSVVEPGRNLDAPRVLRTVGGDFSVVVRLPSTPRSKPGPYGRAYRFRGLLVWNGAGDFLRFGVSSNGDNDGGPMLYDLGFFRNGRDVDGGTRPGDEGPVYLRAERRGNRLYLARGVDGRSWFPFKVCSLDGMPATVQVGVTALGTTDEAFAAEFEDYALRTDASDSLPPGFGFALPTSAPDLGPWGRFFDPLGGTRPVRDGGLLVMHLPERSVRDLNPSSNSSVDAPRTLRAIEGDFQLRVTVRPFAPPRPESSVNHSGNAFHWAGPIVWADEFNFARFGVGRSTVVDGGNATLNEELFRDGQGRLYDSRRVENDRPVHFLMERRGNTLRIASSLDGQTWTDARPGSLNTWPARLYVGVAAVNTGLGPFTAPFDGWSLRTGGSIQVADAVPPGADLGPWGRLVDPVGDVRAVNSDKILTLNLPAGPARDLNSTADPAKNLDAPRTLRPVTGDFSATVRLPAAPRSKGVPAGRTYRFRGLLLWSSRRDFLRFGVSSDGEYDGGLPRYDLEFFRDSRDLEGDIRPGGDGDVYLRAERRGNRLYLSRSSDGRIWFPYKVSNLDGMPATVQVGVVAINTTDDAFGADFEGFSLRTAGVGGGLDLGYVLPPATLDLGPWGHLVDPLRGVESKREGDRLTLDLPDDRPCDLNPNNPDNLSGPRTLRPVEGDFRLQVTVPPFPKPDGDAVVPGRDHCYHWAGPIVWADEFNFARFGVGRNANGDGVSLNLELFRDMKPVRFDARWVDDRPVQIRIERRSDALHVAASSDGKEWVEGRTCDLAGFPARLFVGVGAVNTSTEDFEPSFEGWSLETLAAAPGRAPADAVPAPAADLGAFGRLVDPLGRTEARPIPHGLTLRLPDGMPCDLNTTAGLATTDAPRVLRTVDGNFRFRVKLLPFARPEPNTGIEGRNNAYRWAGPIVWTDEGNFVRFGLSRSAVDHEGKPVTQFEVFEDSARIGDGLWFFDENPIHFEVERRDAVLVFRTSRDGRTWAEHKTLDRPNLPRRLRLGVAALNTGTRAFAPTFEDPSLETQSPGQP